MIDRWLWIWNYRKPIIAQTHSFCLSGGLDLIGACDIVFAAEGTRFGHPAGRALGIPVTIGMLPFKIGGAATKDLLFTGDLIEASRAKELGLVTHVLPPDELDERTAAFCHRVALTPMDGLTVHKHVTNRALEIMGIRLAAMEGAEYDSIFHMTPAAAEFSRRSREEGLRAALDWRDGPFRTGPAADHDAANSDPSVIVRWGRPVVRARPGLRLDRRGGTGQSPMRAVTIWKARGNRRVPSAVAKRAI